MLFVPPGQPDPPAASGYLVVYTQEFADLLAALESSGDGGTLTPRVEALEAWRGTHQTAFDALAARMTPVENRSAANETALGTLTGRVSTLESAPATTAPADVQRITDLETGALAAATERQTLSNAVSANATAIDAIADGAGNILDGDVLYQMALANATGEDARAEHIYRTRWQTGTPLIRFRPLAPGQASPHATCTEQSYGTLYEFEGLTSIRNVPSKIIQIDEGAWVAPKRFVGDNAEEEGGYTGNGWKDPVSTQLSAVFGLEGIPGVALTGRGVINARNERGHIPLAGRARQVFSFTADGNPLSIRFWRSSTGFDQTYSTGWQGTRSATIAQFVADHAAALEAGDGTELSVYDGDPTKLAITSVNEDPLNTSTQGATTGTLGQAYSTGIDNTELDDGGSEQRRSHHAIQIQDCDGATVGGGLRVVNAWFGAFMKSGADYIVDDFGHLGSFDEQTGQLGGPNGGARRPDPSRPGEFIGDYCNAAVTGNDTYDMLLQRITAKDCSEGIDFNPTNFNPTVRDCIFEDIYEGGVELSGAKNFRGYNINGTNCYALIKASAYVGESATGEVYGSTATYNEFCTDAIKALGPCPFVIYDDFKGHGLQVVLEENVDYVRMAAQVLSKNGQHARAMYGYVDLTITGAVGSKFVGGLSHEPVTQDIWTIGNFKEVVYQRGGHVVVNAECDIDDDQTLVVSDGGKIEVVRAENVNAAVTAETGLGTVLRAQSLQGRVRYHIDPFGLIGYARQAVFSADSVASPLYPVGGPIVKPNERADVVVAWFRDGGSVYAEDAEMDRGIRIVGSFARVAYGFGNVPLVETRPATAVADRGLALRRNGLAETAAGYKFGNLSGLLDFSSHRVTARFIWEEIPTGGALRTFHRFGSNDPYRVFLAETALVVDFHASIKGSAPSGGNIQIDLNSVLGGDPVVGRAYVFSIILDEDTRIVRFGESEEYGGGGVAVSEVYNNGGGAPVVYESVQSLLVGSKQDGTDSAGEVDITDYVLSNDVTPGVTAFDESFVSSASGDIILA